MPPTPRPRLTLLDFGHRAIVTSELANPEFSLHYVDRDTDSFVHPPPQLVLLLQSMACGYVVYTIDWSDNGDVHVY